MKIIFILFFIINSAFIFSQKQLTLIIDTIDFVNNIDTNNFKIFITNQGFGNHGEKDTSAIISTSNYPNFQTTINLETDSTTIQIPIDQQNGYLELSNIYESDTIRVNYLKQYSNCYKDTIKTRIEYFKVKNDNVSKKTYKVKYKEKTQKKKCKKRPPFKTALTINGQKYFACIQVKSDIIKNMHGHGYKPKQTEKTHDNYTGSKFHVYSVTFQYINVITIKLIN